MRWFEPRIVRGSDYIVTISHYKQERAEALGKKTWYIPNGCDVPEYDVEACKDKLQGELNLVYCGDQGKYKRTYEIVQAMSRVPKHIKLYLIGYANPELEKYASENVIFLGPKWGNDKWSILAQADVLVCTADTDCNTKFHEYLRMGKPILGYDGIANHLFLNRRNALLTRDYPAAIMELYRAPELRKELAANAARDIPVYSWREIAQQYDQAFAEIVESYNWRARGS
jgi:glycosyltransferase involved in cell wall biosynthesis